MKKEQEKPKATKKTAEEKGIEEPVVGDEPSWYHYLIVLGVLVGIFLFFYFGYNYYDDNYVEKPNITSNVTYKYPYTVGNITYNIYFHSPVDDIEKSDYKIQLKKSDMLTTADFTFVFKDYNGTDNGEVSVAAGKLMRFVETVYGFNVSSDDITHFNETTCANSTTLEKVVVFDPYKNENGVFFERKTGCIKVYTDAAHKQVEVIDKLIYTMINE